MAEKKKKRTKIFETKNFAFIIAVALILLFSFIGSFTGLVELQFLDFMFFFKNSEFTEQSDADVDIKHQNLRLNTDIQIIGIDSKTLFDFQDISEWPFPRYVHGNLLDSFAKIKDQTKRENSVFLDIFFIEPSNRFINDSLLIESIQDNGRVFLETILKINKSENPDEEESYYARHDALYENYGSIKNIEGDWIAMHGFYGLEPPLVPYGKSAKGYGHANFIADGDDVYRRQRLVAKSSRLVNTLFLKDLAKYRINYDNFERLAWRDKKGRYHAISYEPDSDTPFPPAYIDSLTQTIKAESQIKKLYIDTGSRSNVTNIESEQEKLDYTAQFPVYHFRDYFLPSITMSMALEYFNKDVDDMTVILGNKIIINKPEYYNSATQEWVPYTIMTKKAEIDPESGRILKQPEYRSLPKVEIPIDSQGQMLVNFMGVRSSSSRSGYQTFSVLPYSFYAKNARPDNKNKWPAQLGLANKILMVGAFAKGIAEDEKTTPQGLMYGVEIHANALNTILMDNFITYAPDWLNFLILAAMVLIMSFVVARLQSIASFGVMLALIAALTGAVFISFNPYNYIISYTTPVFAIVFTFLSIIVYRAMTEERDKKMIKNMFGKYVNPHVVTSILSNPPELGGVDKEISVFFSDIRGFTTLSETMSPQELVNHLNIYLSSMTDIILEFHGTLDKYVGDEIMCFWGAPLPQPDHSILACKCAVKQMEALRALNETWPPEKQINIGIGVNSGIMTVGNMGSSGRMNYTLMGDNVNLGARLEGTNKAYGTNIIISEFTYNIVKDKVIARELDNIRVKGKNKPVLIYELLEVLD